MRVTAKKLERIVDIGPPPEGWEIWQLTSDESDFACIMFAGPGTPVDEFAEGYYKAELEKWASTNNEIPQP